MNLTFEVKDALTAMLRVLPAIDKRGLVPLHDHAMIATDGMGNASIRTTSAEMDAMATFPARGEGEPIALPAQTLADILRNLPNGADARLTWEDGETRAKLQCGRSRFQLAFLPADAWPMVKAGSWGVELLVKPDALTRALKTVAWAACDDGARHPMLGVNVVVQGVVAIFRATDAKVAAEYRMAVSGPDDAVTTTIPNRMVSEIQRFIGDTRGEVWLRMRQGRVAISDDRGELAAQTIDMPFPDLNRFMVREAPHTITIGRETMMATARRVSSGTGGGDIGIKMSIRSGAVTLTAKGDVGEGADELAAEGGEDDDEIGITDRILIEALSVLDGERVTIGYNGEKPFNMRGEDDAALIVMGTRRV